MVPSLPRGEPLSALSRDVELIAEFSPDLARLLTILDGLGCGFTAQAEQHMVDEKCIAADLPELFADELMK
ncbi:hypothetical protein BFN03_06185 [Rhodococcus sp. WMMA185]|nr:hypothetical protein BFN03_06185 [Rhodococcus sp. WMMA185]